MKYLCALTLTLFVAFGCNAEPHPLLDSGTEDAGSEDAAQDTGGEDASDLDASAEDAGGDAGEDSGEPDAPEADTWGNFAEAFMATYCVECHDGETGAGRDFQILENVVAEQDKIRCGTSDVTLDDCAPSPRAQQFPIGRGPIPDNAERARFVAWIDAGLPE